MRDVYPELSAPPNTYLTFHVLPSQCVQHHSASETVPVSSVESAVKISVGKSESDFHTMSPTKKGNHWLAWYFQLLSPTFLCVLLWNSIGTITFPAKTFGLIILETVLGQCGRFRRSWCSRKRGAHADTIPTSAGCKELGCCRVLLINAIAFFLEVLNFVCKPAVARCLRTRSRRSRKSIAQTSLLLRVLTILLITFIKAIKCICLAFAITSLASVLLHDLKFSDEL